MVDIFSKKDGPRREDVAAKRLINENRATIHRLADQISNGGFSRSREKLRQSRQEPKPDGLIIHILGGSQTREETDPAVRISANNRVFVMDKISGKQLLFLGEIRSRGTTRYFALATEENGFISPLEEDVEQDLEDLNGIVIETPDIQEKFLEVMRKRLEVS
ncbi:hypothetical protein [Roseibium marinum]|uniref:Uncharacterized protein n=1 Tax=Roseibium marinum TaxID=281252 RepID=A0A2S3UT52_9HYPH|nr:hypothetical protein [Roseibium marinum]POF30866.1 hypothetical protein CLV41_10544 [Roseibium marinum]